VPIITFACSLAMELLVRMLFREDNYYQTHGVPHSDCFSDPLYWFTFSRKARLRSANCAI
jgi:hypothetical protein